MSISVCYSINAYNDSVLYHFCLCFVEDHDACILKVIYTNARYRPHIHVQNHILLEIESPLYYNSNNHIKGIVHPKI